MISSTRYFYLQRNSLLHEVTQLKLFLYETQLDVCFIKFMGVRFDFILRLSEHLRMVSN
jgi:hypothetical protein